MKLEIYFEVSYRQTNLSKKKRSCRYISTQDAESTVVNVFSYEGNRTDVLFPAWYRASFL